MNSLNHDLELLEGTEGLLAGIDEVGRGCLFGEVVTACVIMPLDDPIEGIRDSKKLSPKKREKLYDEILEKALAVGIGRVDVETIEEINIRQATRLAMKIAIENCRENLGEVDVPVTYLIDAESVDLDVRQISIKHGDDLSYSIGCASIVAKVFRDRLCVEWDEKYPGYDIWKNKGYGTQFHREALRNLGPTPLHRMSFLGKILNKDVK
ncbi:ribonuclease HII [Peptoniphilus sp. KCTC 25270]|uniref:ribonuclease HII n=1 Tax=Peptoniphilus sp. KCTC 25270 TaxID=2897414 RepID=UPI001E3A609E|nr:ribonuclease HII [Peptoniphilus sp. KCTC 25270]MCD1147083.1 ribonuclease HII [Peptoniphilus sp. KCTC 25270]